MKTTFRNAIAGAALMIAAVSAGAAPVQTAAFTVTLPEGFGEFTTQAQKTDSPEGQIETTNWISKAPTGEAVVITVSKMPAAIADAEKAIAGMRDSLLKSLGATLETEQKIEGEKRASNLLFKSNGVFLRSNLFVDGDRMMQVLYVGRSEEQRNAATVEGLFQSFQPVAAAAETPAAVAATAE